MAIEISPELKLKIRMTVKEYMDLFPEDYKYCLMEVQSQRDNLANDMAEVSKTHAVKRALYTIPEKLHAMVGMKLSDSERGEVKLREYGYWFAKEFPQFAISKKI